MSHYGKQQYGILARFLGLLFSGQCQCPCDHKSSSTVTVVSYYRQVFFMIIWIACPLWKFKLCHWVDLYWRLLLSMQKSDNCTNLAVGRGQYQCSHFVLMLCNNYCHHKTETSLHYPTYYHSTAMHAHSCPNSHTISGCDWNLLSGWTSYLSTKKFLLCVPLVIYFVFKGLSVVDKHCIQFSFL